MISVLMPILKGGDHFIESFTSVYKQSYKDWNILIGVSGEEKLSFYQSIEKYVSSRVHLFYLPGFDTRYEVLNYLAKKSRKDFLAVLDEGDIWHDSKLGIQIPFKLKYDVVGTGAEYFGSNDNLSNVPTGDMSKIQVFSSNPIPRSTVIINRPDAGWPENDVDNWSLYKRLADERKTFFNLPQVMTFNRV